VVEKGDVLAGRKGEGAVERGRDPAVSLAPRDADACVLSCGTLEDLPDVR
jgi:hypothetical protein